VKDLREAAPVWLEAEVAAMEKASGPFGWLWAAMLLLVAVLRHLAGEAPAVGPVAIEHADCGLAAVSAGEAWAAKEEKRFNQPRCC
jgi:hypothetical protein